jgi:hypothetical protein
MIFSLRTFPTVLQGKRSIEHLAIPVSININPNSPFGGNAIDGLTEGKLGVGFGGCSL